MTKVINRKSIFKGKLLEVFEDEILLPNGTKAIHHNASRPPVITVIPIDADGSIYLISQYRYPFGKYVLEAVAGFVEKGEELSHAVKRELKEETGIVAKTIMPLRTVQLSGSVFEAQAHLFLAKELSFDKATPEDDEDITLVKMSIAEAVDKVIAGDIDHAASIVGILLLDTLKRKGSL